MNKKKKNTRGITLIALVISIIVLLILAGVTIAALSGDNGILTRAKEAKEKTEQAQKEEGSSLTEIEEKINDNLKEENVEQIYDKNPGILEQDTSNSDISIINSIEDLVVFSYNVRNGNTYEGKTIKLGVNLDFNSKRSYSNPYRTDYGQYGYDGKFIEKLNSGNGWNSIGNEINIEQNNFKGIFDGNNKSIYNLYINKQDINEERYIGFFANNKGIIKDLSLKNIKIETSGNEGVYYFIAGIAGNNEGIISNCIVDGNYEAKGNYSLLSGICARNQKTVELCINKAKISGEGMYIGGIVAQNLSEIKKCENNGEINSLKNGRYVGGITGLGYSDEPQNGNSIIEESFNKEDIFITIDKNSIHAGGIVGQAQCKIKNCYNMGNISINTETSEKEGNIGGIAGLQVGEVQNCYNKNVIEIKESDKDLKNISTGGIIGKFHQYTSKNLYSETLIKSNNAVINGALIGTIITEPHVKEINNLLFYGQQEAIGTNLAGVEIQCTKSEEKPAESEIMKCINIDENKFVEDTNNINGGYPILYWQKK